ncbi:MAG TPA: substrate-binding domain-containing protein, partial [Clostridia bacterium]
MKIEFVFLRLGLKITSSFSRRPCLRERAGSEIIEKVIFKRCLKGLKLILLSLFVLLTSVGCKSVNTSANIPDEVHKTLPEQTTHIKKSNEIIIAMVPKSLDNPVFLDAKEEGERVAKKLGIKLEWLGSMQSDPTEQAAIVESLIIRQVDGIVISCADPEKMRPIINKAVKAGIKVATFDSDSPGSDRIFYCGTNNYAAGDACAKALIKALKAKKRSKDELNLLIMSADKDSYNLNERLRSFMDTAQKGGLKLHVIDTLYCKDDINMAGDML